MDYNASTRVFKLAVSSVDNDYDIAICVLILLLLLMDKFRIQKYIWGVGK